MNTIIEIPASLLSATEISFRIGRRHITSPQPFTDHLRVSGPTDERWITEMTLAAGDREVLDTFQTIFDTADGLSGFFSAFDCVHAYPRGTATGLIDPNAGTPDPGVRFDDGATFDDGSLFDSGITYGTVGAAAAKGAEYLNITGLLADQAVGFAVGDHLSIVAGSAGSSDYGLLHHCIAATATDSSGSASVRVRPRLRQAVAAGQKVSLLRPRGVFRLAEESAATFSRGPGGIGAPSLSLIEAPEAIVCAL